MERADEPQPQVTLPSGNLGAGDVFDGFSSASTAKRSQSTAVTLSSYTQATDMLTA